MKRIDIENLRDSIKSSYNVEIDYDTYEQELMCHLEKGWITEDEFIADLKEHYADLEKEQSEEEI